MMHALLIVGGNLNERVTYVQTFVQQHNIHPTDVLTVTTDTSIGIEAIRQLEHFLTLKPYASTLRVATMPNASDMTVPAQHAMLKTLEEPPPHARIFLLAPYEETLLPTIISRCQLVRLAVPQKGIEEKTIDQTVDFWQKVTTTKPETRISLIPELGKERNAFLHFIEEHISILEHVLVKRTNSPILTPQNTMRIIKKLIAAHHAISGNCHPQLMLDNVFFNL